MPTKDLPRALCGHCGNVRAIKPDGTFWPHNNPKDGLLCLGCCRSFEVPTTKQRQRDAAILRERSLEEAAQRAREERFRINAGPPQGDDWHEFMRKRIAARARGETVD